MTLHAYPSVTRWRSSLIGLISIAMETVGFILVKLFEMGIWGFFSRHTPEHLGFRLLMASFGLFAVSAPVALIGALIDRRKVVSIVVLGTWMPPLVFLLLWSGYW
jgi:hypothetical protein